MMFYNEEKHYLVQLFKNVFRVIFSLFCFIHVLVKKGMDVNQGFQYFSSLPVLHYLQAVLFIKI